MYRFLSDCMGQPALIADGSFSTKLPADVDEDVFDPRASFLPIPAFKDGKLGWCKSEFKYFELKCRYVLIFSPFRYVPLLGFCSDLCYPPIGLLNL
jgi:hypothetical protein